MQDGRVHTGAFLMCSDKQQTHTHRNRYNLYSHLFQSFFNSNGQTIISQAVIIHPEAAASGLLFLPLVLVLLIFF